MPVVVITGASAGKEWDDIILPVIKRYARIL